MTTRTISQRVRALEVTEGAGVQVFRSIGTPARRNLDPFLMLDHFSSANPDDYLAGFPEHPHRGFITLTYMLAGHMEHRDSMGNRGDLGPGGAQWMKAASGIIHSEMPKQIDGLMQGFQLWINLPAAEKMSAPAYRDIPAGEIPVVDDGDARVKVLAGQYADKTGPIVDPHTGLTYLDVSLKADAAFVRGVGAGEQVFLYLFEGALQTGDQAIPAGHLAVLTDGDQVSLRTGSDGARFLLLAGRPLDEPIVQYGPFVMNTREEIEQAAADYRDGRLVRDKAAAG
jgi:quercetin 2,3-dioxygenase